MKKKILVMALAATLSDITHSVYSLAFVTLFLVSLVLCLLFFPLFYLISYVDLLFLCISICTLITPSSLIFLLQSSGQQIPVVVESCIRFINLHGESVFMVYYSILLQWAMLRELWPLRMRSTVLRWKYIFVYLCAILYGTSCIYAKI